MSTGFQHGAVTFAVNLCVLPDRPREDGGAGGARMKNQGVTSVTGLHSRRRFLSVAGGTMAGVAVTSAAFYGATDLMRASAAENGGFDGVSSPQHTDLTPFKDKLRHPPKLAPKHQGITEIEMVNQTLRLHSELPPVPGLFRIPGDHVLVQVR
jgi:hypothetical protein